MNHRNTGRAHKTRTFIAALAFGAAAALGAISHAQAADTTLLNVSYDPTACRPMS
ncbi:MAG: Sulfate and thiosulfate binding protein CysP [uncultured Paraburkholderia sp.]|nr:MAG: Sulfate and thiosulfate binding protein CysP [uncultured Paraburkholderia sp.]